MQRFRLKFFDNTPIGRVVTRNVSDIETISDIFGQGIAAIIGDILLLVGIVILMFLLNWKLTLISLSTLPLLFLTTYVFKEKVKISFNEVIKGCICFLEILTYHWDENCSNFW